MQKIYINESLSPETRKLLYKTKQFTREIYRVQGKLFVWTFKGDIYIRKDVIGAPKIRVTSELDLKKIVEGKTSLDTSSVLHVNNSEKNSNDKVYYVLSNDSNDIDVITV